MFPFALGILVAGVLALGTSFVLFCTFRFERFVGLRYLQKNRKSGATRAGLYASLAATAAGLLLFFGVHGQQRQLETVGVVLALVAALAAMLFLLLRFFSVFTTVSTIGVVLGVASLVVVLAVTSGFEREFQDKVLGVNAHLIVTSYGIERDFAEAERTANEIKTKLAGLPGLVRLSKFSFSAGEVMIGRVGANLKGVDVAAGAPELKRALVQGSVEALGRAAMPCSGAARGEAGQVRKDAGKDARKKAGKDSGEPGTGRMILGAELARKLRAKTGQCVSVLVPFAGGAAAAPSSFPFRVVGIFEMGFHEYDSRLAFISLEDARHLANARQSIFGVELRFSDPAMALSMQPEVERRLGPEPRIIDWRTLNHNLFMALTMQKLIIALLLVLIILVAAFNIVASLTLIVLSKVREIAILSSMGARSVSLLRIFLVSGSVVGFVGTGLGLVYGLAVCGLATLYNFPLDPKVYLITRLPVEIAPGEILFVAAATQLICFLATLYPALRAGRLRVLEGLRYT